MCLFLLLLWTKLISQEGFQYKVLHLPDNADIHAVGDILQTTDGNYWFATNDGLYRYNGSQFLKLQNGGVLSIPDNDIKLMANGKGNKLWLLFNTRQLYSLNTKTLKAEEYKLPGLEKQITSIHADGDDLYLSCLKGDVYRINDTTLQRINGSGYEQPLLVQFVHDGKIWLKTELADKLLTLDIISGEYSDVIQGSAVWVYKGKVEYLNNNGGIYAFKDGSWQKQEQLDDGQLTSVKAVGRGNSVWLSDFSGKLYLKKDDDTRFTDLTPEVKQQFGNQVFLSLYADDQQQLWIGTSRTVKCINQNVDSAIKQVLSLEIKHDYEVGFSSRTIFELDTNRLMIFTYSGSFIYDRAKDSLYKFTMKMEGSGTLGVPFMEVHRLEDGTLAGLCEGEYLSFINPDDLTLSTVRSDRPEVASFFLTMEKWRNGEYLIGGNGGLYRFQVRDSSYSLFENQDLKMRGREIWDIEILNDEEFALATTDGIFICTEKKILNHITQTDGNEIGPIHCTGSHTGDFYAGSKAGLLRVRNGIASNVLPGFEVYSLLILENRFWLGTDNGLLVYYPEDRSWFRFGREHGLSSDEFNRKSASLLSDGTLAFGGINGVNLINPNKLLGTASIDSVYISQLSLKKISGDTVVYAQPMHDFMETDWKVLSASFGFVGDQVPLNYNIWINGGEGWKLHSDKVLQLNADDFSADQVKIKLQFPSGTYSNEISIAATKNNQLLGFWIAGIILSGILIFFIGRKRHKPPGEATFDESLLGRTTEVLFVKPCGNVDDHILQKLYTLQNMIIESPIEEEVNAESLAAQAHTSERQLYRIFKESVGLTPRQFVNKVRLRNSLYLLYSGEYNKISQVAADAGFKKASYFSRIFREEYGFSPLKILKRGN